MQLAVSDQHAMLGEEVRVFFLDWWMLGRCALMATSHSSYSYTAALYSAHEDRGSFWRPDPILRRIAPFLPWHTLYDDKAFDGVL